MGKKLRVLYLGTDPGAEFKRLEKIAQLAYHYAGVGILQLHGAETFREFKNGGGRIGVMDLIYLASPTDIDEVLLQRAGKCDERLRGDFRGFYREINKIIARRLDGGLCVPCRLLKNKLVKGGSVHHLVYGEYMPDEFTYLMTACGLGPTTPGTHHANFHARKVENALEMLTAIKKKLAGARYWRWQGALEHYEKRVVRRV